MTSHPAQCASHIGLGDQGTGGIDRRPAPARLPGAEPDAVYSVVTSFFMQWRLFIRLGQAAREASPLMAANLRRTGYAFLKKGK